MDKERIQSSDGRSVSHLEAVRCRVYVVRTLEMVACKVLLQALHRAVELLYRIQYCKVRLSCCIRAATQWRLSRRRYLHKPEGDIVT